MKLWQSVKASHYFFRMIQFTVLAIPSGVLLGASLLFFKNQVWAITCLFLIFLISFVAIYYYSRKYSEHAYHEFDVNMALEELGLIKVKNEGVKIVLGEKGDLSYILYKSFYYFHDGQKGIYFVNTVSFSQNIQLYKIICFNNPTSNNVYVVCEKDGDQKNISVYKHQQTL